LKVNVFMSLLNLRRFKQICKTNNFLLIGTVMLNNFLLRIYFDMVLKQEGPWPVCQAARFSGGDYCCEKWLKHDLP